MSKFLIKNAIILNENKQIESEVFIENDIIKKLPVIFQIPILP
jgi:dihydroorotase-like cyclic amidohydrolase